MRSRFLMVILFVSAITFSCKKESVERGENDPAVVGFATKLSALSETKSIIGSPTQLAEAGGFNVWGYEHTGIWASASIKTALFNGTPVTSSDGGSTWSYGTPVNWPETSNVSFFAYGPAGAASYTGPDGSGVPEIGFTVANTLAAQKDLMIATHRPDQSGMSYGNNPLILTFNHALSQIKFSASLVGDFLETSIKITRIELRNLYNSGSTTLQTPVAWTLGLTRADYSLTPSSGLEDINLTSTSQDITPVDGGLMLMPQTINRPTDPVELYVEITFDGVAVDYTVPLFSPSDWLPGKSYRYHISVDKGEIQVIVIDSDIDLDQWKGSVILQTIVLTSDETRDENVIIDAIKTLNEANNGTTTNNYTHFGIYGVNDMDHDIILDFIALKADDCFSNFKSGQFLMFDFKKMIRNWNVSVIGDPWGLHLTNYGTEWELVDAWQHPDKNQYPGVDASTGATLPANYGGVTVNPWSSIYAKGSIILRKR